MDRLKGVTLEDKPEIIRQETMTGPDGKERLLPAVAEHKARRMKHPHTGEPVDFSGFPDDARVFIRFRVKESSRYPGPS
jgi:hypothetical protein